MIAKLFSLAVLSAAGFGNPGDKNTINTIELGSVCPMQTASMKNVDGTSLVLGRNKQENGLLVVFSCNTCPFVIGDGGESQGWEGRYNTVHEWAKRAKVGMVLINSNQAKRDNGDGFDDMVKRANEKGYTMPYLLDEGSELANAFGAKTTPHVFLFDKELKLVYRGSIDDNVKSASDVKESYLEVALRALSSGQTIKTNDTRPVGCSIKRKAS